MDYYVCEADWQLRKTVKKWRVNPLGEDAYLAPDGTVAFDEDKIVRAQQIFKENFYKPGGKGANKILEKYKNDNSNMENI